MIKKKVLIYGCGLIGSSISFLLDNNDVDVYLTGDFNSEKEFLKKGFIEYNIRGELLNENSNLSFNIEVKKFNLDKNFFIPDLIVASFKIVGILKFNEFLKKIEDKIIQSNIIEPGEKIELNILFIQNGYGWEKYIEKNYKIIKINILRGIVLYNVSKIDNKIIQTSKGELILEKNNILKELFQKIKKTKNKNKLIFESIIKVRFTNNISYFIINKLIINFTNGIFTYLNLTFYEAIKNRKVAILLKNVLEFLILIIKKNKIKIVRFNYLDPIDIIDFIYITYEKKSIFIFFKFYLRILFLAITDFIKLSILGSNRKNFFILIKNIIKLTNYKNLKKFFLESLPKGYNSLYKTLCDVKKEVGIDELEFNLINEFSFIVSFFIDKCYNIKIKKFNKNFLNLLKSEIDKIFYEKITGLYEKTERNNETFEKKLTLLIDTILYCKKF
ncbi:MAG: hypothetical protein N3A58_07045 [Spirochaetes bacterium]|nr:hypothetical protein [Spirochaetota bacterium]